MSIQRDDKTITPSEVASSGKGSIMKKKSVLTIMLLLMIVLTGFGIINLLKDKGDSWSSRWNHTVTVQNKAADPGQSVAEFTISEGAEYSIALSWNLQGEGKDLTKASEDGGIGFVTGCVISDPEGNMVYGTAATAVYLDTTLRMEPGNYQITYTYLTSEEDYIEFAKKYLCGEMSAKTWAKDLDFQRIVTDGSRTLDFELKVHKQLDGTWQVFAALFSILTAICVAVILLAAFSKGKQLQSPRYDERQELERGRGFRYGFFTLLISIGCVLCFDWTGVIPEHNQTVFYATCIFMGLLVYASYCIWHESYFALNQKTNAVLVFFTLIGLFNIALGISSIVDGSLVQNGIFETRFLNLECGVLFLILMVVLLVKRARDKKKDAADEDEE